MEAAPDPETLARLFRHKVLRLLLDAGAIDQAVVANLLAWPHTGFGAHVSRAIPADHRTPEIVARYMTRTPIVPDRILGDGATPRVIYRSDMIHPRHHANFRAFGPLDFLAELSAHIPDPHEKTTLFYGWYSNRTRGFRRARGLLAQPGPAGRIPTAADQTPLAVRRSWARLIRKIYEVDPLVCPRCGATMKVIAVIEDEEVISRILSHLNLLVPGGGPQSPPQGALSASPREWVYEPLSDDCPWPDSA